MEIDPATTLGIARRAVRNVEMDGKPASIVTLARTYDTSVDDLWDVLTNKERIPRWFLPVEGDLKLGGRYQFKGNAGGTITECIPPTQFAATWEFGGSISWIAVAISADGIQARLTLEHTVIHTDHWDKFGPAGVGIGWDLAAIALGRHLATGHPFERSAVEAWMASPNYKELITISGKSWFAEYIGSDVDPASAEVRTTRSIAFYRGETPPDMVHSSAAG